MSLIKISPKYQITIPQRARKLCSTNWLSFTIDGGIMILRPVDIQEAKSEQEVIDELLKAAEKQSGT